MDEPTIRKIRHVELSFLVLMIVIIAKKFFEYSYFEEAYCFFINIKVPCAVHMTSYVMVFLHNGVIGIVMLLGHRNVSYLGIDKELNSNFL
jgi:hypothetical protein